MFLTLPPLGDPDGECNASGQCVSLSPSTPTQTVQGTLGGIKLIKDQLANKQIPKPNDGKDKDLKDVVKKVQGALKDVNKTPPDTDGAIKDLSKASEELNCDKMPVSDTKKDLCNSLVDAMIKLLNTMHSTPPAAGSNIFIDPLSTVLASARDKLNAPSTLKKKGLGKAAKELKDAEKKLTKNDLQGAIEELTKASNALKCDNGPGLEQTLQGICDAIVDSKLAVATKMIIP